MRQPDLHSGLHRWRLARNFARRAAAATPLPPERLCERLPLPPPRPPRASLAGRRKTGAGLPRNQRTEGEDCLLHEAKPLRLQRIRRAPLAQPRVPMREWLQPCRDTLPATRRAEESFPRKDSMVMDRSHEGLPDGDVHSRRAAVRRDCRSREIRRLAARHISKEEGFVLPDRPADVRRDCALPGVPSARGPGRGHRHNSVPGGRCDRCRSGSNNSVWD